MVRVLAIQRYQLMIVPEKHALFIPVPHDQSVLYI